MKQTRKINRDDDDIHRLKRDGQARSRQLVKDGVRSQESMFLIPPDVAKTSKVKYKL